MCAKSASAATAALGFAGYLLSVLDLNNELWRMGVALAAVVVLTVLGAAVAPVAIMAGAAMPAAATAATPRPALRPEVEGMAAARWRPE